MKYVVTSLAVLALAVTACDKSKDSEAPADKASAAKAEEKKPEKAVVEELDPKNPPAEVAKVMEATKGLRGVAPFSKYREKIGERLGEPTRTGTMYDKPLHEWAAHKANLCVHYKLIQQDPSAKTWTGWDPDMLTKPKDGSDMLATRNWKDCLNAAKGIAKK